MSSALAYVAEPTVQDVLPFERRAEHRRPASGRVTAVTRGEGVANRICSLELVDMSDGGLGATCPDPIEIGSPIAVYFAPHGPERGMDLFGKVVRCHRRADGHAVGIRFAARAAA